MILPFFITFIIRTLAWKTIFADSSVIDQRLRRPGAHHQRSDPVAPSGRVIGGLTYNFLPFMILPIYVSIEKIDPRLLEAARDLYAGGDPDLPQGRCCRSRCPACSPGAC